MAILEQGQLIYVNYGRVEDFTWLKEDKGVNFRNKICIARYGKIFRGDKVGAIGVGPIQLNKIYSKRKMVENLIFSLLESKIILDIVSFLV